MQNALVPDVNQGTAVASPLNLGVLANQIPPLPKFSGETDSGKGDSETFADWRERFEMVAEAYRWDQPTKLVNLVTRLCGQAYSFYVIPDSGQTTRSLLKSYQDVSHQSELKRCRAVFSMTDDRRRKNLLMIMPRN